MGHPSAARTTARVKTKQTWLSGQGPAERTAGSPRWGRTAGRSPHGSPCCATTSTAASGRPARGPLSEHRRPVPSRGWGRSDTGSCWRICRERRSGRQAEQRAGRPPAPLPASRPRARRGMPGPKRARSPTRRVSPGCFVSRSREGKKLSRGPPTKSPGRPAGRSPTPAERFPQAPRTDPAPARPHPGSGALGRGCKQAGAARPGASRGSGRNGDPFPPGAAPPQDEDEDGAEARGTPASQPPPPCPAHLARPPQLLPRVPGPTARGPRGPSYTRRRRARPAAPIGGRAGPRRAPPRPAPPAGARAAAEAGGLRRGERPRGGGRGAAAVRLKKTGIWRKNGEALAVADPAPSPCCRPVAVAGAGSVRRLPCRRPPGAQRPGGRAGVRASAPRAPSAGGGRPCRKPAARRESRCCGRRRRRAAGFVRRGWKGSLPPAGTGRVRGGISPTGRVPAAWRLRRYEERFQGESPLYSLLI